MPSGDPDFLAILETLCRHKVEFLVVGGVCAVLHGAPIATFDLDIVHSRERGNVERLCRALEELDAYYREHPQTRPAPDADRLAGRGRHLLMTRHGPLDVLGFIVGDRDYDDLLPGSMEVALSAELTVRILQLQTLIETKSTGHEKDQAILPILRRVLEEQKRST